jgi:hypothetical protein
MIPTVAKLAEENGRLIVIDASRRYRVLAVDEPKGRPPTEEEMASGAMPGPIQPPTPAAYGRKPTARVRQRDRTALGCRLEYRDGHESLPSRRFNRCRSGR